MNVDIVIVIAGIDLFPDACFYLLLFIFPDQVVEAFPCKAEEFIYIFISGHLKELMVCIQEFIIIFVRSVYDKCTRKVFRDIFECKSELFADSSPEPLPVSHTSVFSVKLYFIKCCICTAHKL